MLDIAKIESILASSDKLVTGMKKYTYIMGNLHRTDVSADRDFQRTFNSFFVMRSRKREYYALFYQLLEQKKDCAISFAEALDTLKRAEGRLETSFASKLAHVINPTLPIWDYNVAVLHFEMKLPGYGMAPLLRQQEIIKAYDAYCGKFNDYLDSAEGQLAIRLFNEKYPHTGFTDAKKADFLMWVDVQ